MNKVKIYIRDQIQYFSVLFLILVVPLTLFHMYSPYPLPYVEYAILGALFIFQYMLFNEKDYRKSIEPRATLRLEKDLKRRPSKTEVVLRLKFLIGCRRLTIFINALLVIIIMIIFKQF